MNTSSADPHRLHCHPDCNPAKMVDPTSEPGTLPEIRLNDIRQGKSSGYHLLCTNYANCSATRQSPVEKVSVLNGVHGSPQLSRIPEQDHVIEDKKQMSGSRKCSMPVRGASISNVLQHFTIFSIVFFVCILLVLTALLFEDTKNEIRSSTGMNLGRESTNVYRSNWIPQCLMEKSLPGYSGHCGKDRCGPGEVLPVCSPVFPYLR